MNHRLLYLVPVFIWGSTWMAIKYQLGVVDPIISVVYRFALASIVLLSYSRIKGYNLRFSLKEHLFMALQGIFLFGINYWLVYVAEQTLPSGLVALVFSTIVFSNTFNGFIFLRSRIRLRVILAGTVGLFGVFLIFKDEILNFSLGNKSFAALAISLLSAYLASLGNITSAYNQKIKIPVLQANGFGMLYGSVSLFLVAILLGKPISFDPSFSYLGSLFYLAVFGSVIAFTAYLSVLGRIGADKAATVTLAIPVIALILSTVFEGYAWSVYAVTGALLVILGNFLALRSTK